MRLMTCFLCLYGAALVFEKLLIPINYFYWLKNVKNGHKVGNSSPFRVIFFLEVINFKPSMQRPRLRNHLGALLLKCGNLPECGRAGSGHITHHFLWAGNLSEILGRPTLAALRA